jgi:hypothetical protein
MNFVIFIFGYITILIIYISSLTSFFSLYYYDEEKHNNIKIYGYNNSSYKLALFTLKLYYIATIIIAFFINIIIGILNIILLTLFTIFMQNYIKNNMEIISEIHCGVMPPIFIKFINKRYELFLIPILNPIIISLYIAFIIIMILIK